MSKILDRLERLIRFVKECIANKYTGQIIIHFTQGCPTDITRNEKIKLDN